MTRVKRGVTTHKRHKKVLQQAKGYRMTRRRLYKVAKESVLHAGEYAFAGRKHRKRQFRRLWIQRINAALKPLDIKYSEFIHLLKTKNVIVDRKVIANLAQDSQLFNNFVTTIKKIKPN